MAFGDYLHCPVCIEGQEEHGWNNPDDGTEGRDSWPGYKMMYVGHLEEPDGMVCFCHKHAPSKQPPE